MQQGKRNDMIIDGLSYVLDVESREVAAVDVVHRRFCVSACSCLLPDSANSSRTAWGEEVGMTCESVESFEVSSSSLGSEGLEEDQIFSVLQGSVLDVFNRLEEGCYLSEDLFLLLCFVPKWQESYP